MKIEGVVVSCYKHDFDLTRVCVASIRFWYPDLPIWLLKDLHYGAFDTGEIERCWDVRVYPSKSRNLGWGFGKLEVMTELPQRRFLFLDSDIVFAGRVIDRLEKFDEDFVVHNYDYGAQIESQFFSPHKLREVDPEFVFPGWGFNSGQVVATTGLITKEDLSGLIDWQTRKVSHPDVFMMGEQGLINYMVQRKVQNEELTVHREAFMVWPGDLTRVEHINIADLTPLGVHQELIHWAGLRWGRRISEMPRCDILFHFEDLYYSRIAMGGLRRTWRNLSYRLRNIILKRPIAAVRRLRDNLRFAVAQ